jgi:hypothetical protein
MQLLAIMFFFFFNVKLPKTLFHSLTLNRLQTTGKHKTNPKK